MSFFALLWSWIQSAWTAAKQAQPLTTPDPIVTTSPTGQTVTTPPTLQQNLEAIIEHDNGTFGPSPTTGGIVHAIDAAARTQIARLIIQYANPGKGLPVSLFAAWICAESRFDHLAYNPNHQVAKPGETAAEAALHADVGLAQIDGKELAAMPEFAGMSWQDVQATAFDPTWAVPMMAEICLGLIAWALQQQSENGSDPAWGLDPYVLACQSYNSGRTGALKLELGKFSYGEGVVNRWHQYATVLGA